MVCSVTHPSKGSLHTKTSQLISIANKMTGLYATQPFTEKHFRTDYNDISCIKYYLQTKAITYTQHMNTSSFLVPLSFP